LRHYDRTQHIRFTVDDEVAAVGPYAVISNSDPYAYVGRRRLHIAPAASLDDELTLTVLRSLRGDVVVRAVVAAVGSVRYLTSSSDVVQRAHLHRIDVGADSPFPWQVDGDYLGEVDHLVVSFRPDCLTLVVP
jgi:diacylglycerol kinase family enzyme